jgi:hypothetical protein
MFRTTANVTACLPIKIVNMSIIILLLNHAIARFIDLMLNWWFRFIVF